MKLFNIFLLLLSLTANATELTLTKENTVVLSGFIDNRNIDGLYFDMAKMAAKLPKDQPLYVIINTPGGEVQMANEYIDLTSSLNRPVHTVTAMAAGAGFNVVQGLGKRYVLKDGTFVAFRPSNNAEPHSLEPKLQIELNQVLEQVKYADQIAAKRLGLSLDDYRSLIKDQHWVSGQNAVVENFADEVVTVNADKEFENFLKH